MPWYNDIHVSLIVTAWINWCFSRLSSKDAGVRKTRPLNSSRKDRKLNLRPVVKKLILTTSEAGICDEKDDESEKEEKIFNPAGYEPLLVEILEKDILQRNPDVQWNKVAGLHEAKSVLQEAMVLPILMPDFFKVCSTFQKLEDINKI